MRVHYFYAGGFGGSNRYYNHSQKGNPLLKKIKKVTLPLKTKFFMHFPSAFSDENLLLHVDFETGASPF